MNDLTPPDPTKTVSLGFWPSVSPTKGMCDSTIDFAPIFPPRKHGQNRAFASTTFLGGTEGQKSDGIVFAGSGGMRSFVWKVVYHGLRSGKARFLSWNLFFDRTSFFKIDCLLIRRHQKKSHQVFTLTSTKIKRKRCTSHAPGSWSAAGIKRKTVKLIRCY